MMNILITAIAAIIVIAVVILIHELGHFIVARLAGVKVLKFSLGFGKSIWSYRAKSGTEYAVGILPLGGYVKMLGEDDLVTDQAELKHAFHKKPLFWRITIVAAGPLTNFLLAIVLFWLIFMIGVTHLKPIVGQVLPNSIAAQAGLKSGDEIIRINNMRTFSWQRVLWAIIGRIGDKNEMHVTVLPEKSKTTQTLTFSLANWQLDQTKPEFLRSLGFSAKLPKIEPIVGRIVASSPAAHVGFKVGDKILAIDGKAVDDWITMIQILQKYPGQVVPVRIIRDGKQLTLTVKLGAKMEQGKQVGFLGIEVKMPKFPSSLLVREKYGFFSAWGRAIEQTWTLTAFNVLTLGKIIVGKVSIRTLGGPITIVRTAGQASRAGIISYLSFVAFISIALGFVNLLPIPGLDGGHLLFYFIEAVFRKPVPERYQIILLKIGLLILIFLILLATMNDILRLF